MQSAYVKLAMTVVTLLFSTPSWAQMPVQTGIQEWRWCGDQAWIPASAGMTE